jgi:hypothetical protein
MSQAMPRRSKTIPDLVPAAGAASGKEAQQLQEVLRRHRPWPKGVERVQLRYGEDSEGSPAVWIVFVASNNMETSKEALAAIRHAAEELRSDIRQTGTVRWPYIMIETEAE